MRLHHARATDMPPASRVGRIGWQIGVPVMLLASALAAWVWKEDLMGSLPPRWRIAVAAWRFGVQVDHDILVPMPDGVRLSASLYRPRRAEGPLPTVLVRLPYHRLRYGEGYNTGLFFARHGYAVLVQDLRGSGDSGGAMLPWRDAAEDGGHTLDWIARQPWSTGKVGTFGCSALGETQLVLARLNHPAHLAMIASGAGGAVGSAAQRYGYFGLFEGGIFELASGFGWLAFHGSRDPQAPPPVPFDTARLLRELPVSGLVARVRPGPNAYTDFLSTPLGDPRWASWGYLSETDQTRVPALVINTWGDQTVGDALALAEQWRRSGLEQKVIVAPGNHCQHEESATADRFGELPVAHADAPWREWYLAWFDHWLRGQGDGLASLKPYTYFMLVADRWHTADRWPPAEAAIEHWYLDSDGRANSRKGDGRLTSRRPDKEGFDAYTYDPLQPVPSRGGPVCCTGNPRDPSGPADQADIEAREDVLVYTSDPLSRDLPLAGPLSVHLQVSSSAVDTDVVARLVHVRPDGRATSIQEGALRLRYRAGITRPQLMRPGETVQADVDLRSIAYLVPRGHRLRLQITSSSFPRLERNLNTGAPNNADETRAMVAVNRIHHGPLAQSYLMLPVLAEAETPAADQKPTRGW